MLNETTGRYGEFGGRFVPEILIKPLQELEEAYQTIGTSLEFQQEFEELLQHYAGRPTPLTEAKNFSQTVNGPRVFLKREDLLHTGAHKINNALGQCLLAKYMGKKRIIAETGAGQHGVATATACAHLGLTCHVYMGNTDIQRQQPNVAKMQLLGAQVYPVDTGSKTLKDAVNEALRDWSAHYTTSHYCLGSALGPHPFPQMVAYFHAVIGTEAHQQILIQTQQLPTAVIACVGGGSNAIGIFQGFLKENVKLIGVEAGGHGKQLGEHAARFAGGSPGVLHGSYTYLLQDEYGQIAQTASISAGLDYPAIGPQHAYLKTTNRAYYTTANNDEALAAFKLLSQAEGIVPAFESAHALAYIMYHSHKFNQDDIIIVNLSGRGDKDLPQYFNHFAEKQ